MAILGIFQLGLSYVCMSRGLAGTSAGAASLITALEPLLSPVWVALFCGEMPGRAALPGMALVLASVPVSYTHLDVYKRQGPAPGPAPQ